MLDEGLQSIPAQPSSSMAKGLGEGGKLSPRTPWLTKNQHGEKALKRPPHFGTSLFPEQKPFFFVSMPAEAEVLWMAGYWALSLIPKAWDQYFMRGRGILRGPRVAPSGLSERGGLFSW